jgi:hypothetical protein
MPKGSVRPVANVSTRGERSPGRSRRILTRPEKLSVTKMSPFGARFRYRGADTPVVYASIVNPCGTCGHADGSAGR